jgi:queuine tRNA-ribosyltransferase
VSLDQQSSAFAHALQSAQRAEFGFTPELAEAARSLLAARRYESARASWRLVLGDARVELARLPACSVDVVFWDPYSPRSNPELWSEQAFAAARRLCRERATLHTYGAATATRSALLLAAFHVGFGPALGKKQRRATIAATCLDDLARPLDRAWLANFPRSPSHDPALSCEALSRVSRAPQFA